MALSLENCSVKLLNRWNANHTREKLVLNSLLLHFLAQYDKLDKGSAQVTLFKFTEAYAVLISGDIVSKEAVSCVGGKVKH